MMLRHVGKSAKARAGYAVLYIATWSVFTRARGKYVKIEPRFVALQRVTMPRLSTIDHKCLSQSRTCHLNGTIARLFLSLYFLTDAFAKREPNCFANFHLYENISLLILMGNSKISFLSLVITIYKIDCTKFVLN